MPLKPENYRKAAEIVHASHMASAGQMHQCCCIALARSGKSGTLTGPDPNFGEYFKPKHLSPFNVWFGLPYFDFMNGDTAEETSKRMEHRVFALLLMSEIVKDFK